MHPSLGGPRPKTVDLQMIDHTNGSILMPGDRPVQRRRFVEQNRANCISTRSKNLSRDDANRA